jgi:transcriptional regulator with XRE-family HTH domain
MHDENAGSDPPPQPSDAVLALAAFVRATCAEKRLSQRELARRSGLRRELVGRIARGQANPSMTAVIKLVHGMGLSLRELGEALERMPSAEPAPSPAAEPSASPPSTKTGDQ